jgi:hypothetical protein
MRSHRGRLHGGWLLAIFAACATPAAAQQILLDKPVRAGALILFPDLNDEHAYYYMANKPRLATDENGRPQFSFFRWVDNVRSAADQPEAREGDGGGIIHALVAFGVTKEQLREAEQELRRTHSGARLAGPIVPKEGTFGIISTMKDPKDAAGKFSVQVLGVGNAPLLDGDKAAVSILLTKAGAKVLWEQFQTPTPDLSFTFEMKVSGFLAPKRAVIEANLDEIVAHDAFAAGLAGTFLAAEINGTFDDLRKRNVIKLTQVGEDEHLKALLDTAYSKLTELLFDKVNATGMPSLPGAGGEDGALSRASKLLTAARTEAQTHNDAIRKEKDDIRVRNEGRLKAQREAQAARDRAAQTQRDLDGARAAAAQYRQSADTEKNKAAEANKRADEARTKVTAQDGLAAAVAGRITALAERLAAAQTDTERQQLQAEKTVAEDELAAVNVAKDDANRRLSAAEAERDGAQKEAEKFEGQAGGEDSKAATLGSQADEAQKNAAKLGADAPDQGEIEEPREEESVPGFAVAAMYQMRRTRAQGVFRVDLNKYTSDTRNFPFAENIGDLRHLFNSGHFRQVNLDDPLYRQREIVAVVDGLNAADFGQYVNFVSVRMRKKHDGGEETNDEVRIDRKNFNKEGNAFKLLYGWKGDANRRRWMDYEYQAVWSFFGGHLVEQPWKATSAGSINLAPPFQRRTVDLQADPKRLAERGVRAITVKLFYKLGDREQARQLTINAAAEKPAGQIEFVAEKDALDFDYEITWALTGNRSVSSGRKTTSSTILFIDDPTPAESGKGRFP